MKQPKDPEAAAKKRRRHNVKDVIRDEIYGAAVKMDEVPITISGIGGTTVICIPVEEVKEIAKRIMKRTAIGPI